MAVSPGEVRRIAELARLRLEPTEIEAMAAELSSVLAHMEALAEVDPGEGRWAPAGGDGPPALRPDAPGPDPLTVPPEGFAPELRDGLFTLPRVAFHLDGPLPAEGEDGAS